jgi:hypothetical protein
LIQMPDKLALKLPALRRLCELKVQDMIVAEALKTLEPVVGQAELLEAQYDAVVANPPYMGGRFYCPALKSLVNTKYTTGKADLYGAFMLRNISLAKEHGRIGMITIPNWMFLSSFQELRDAVIEKAPISSLVHNGRGVWGSDFGSCSFILWRNAPQELTGCFLRLFDRQGSVASNDELKRRFFESHHFSIANDEFSKIPGSPIAYWPTERVREIFASCSSLADVARPRQGMASTNDDLFLRRWHEVQLQDSNFNARSCEEAANSQKKWFPFLKGGDFRRWYGNNEFVVNFKNDGQDVCDYIDSTPGARVASSGRIINRSIYFHPVVTWTLISSANTAFRLCESGFILGHKGPGISANTDTLNTLLPFLNSCVTSSLLGILAPSIGFEVGQVAKLPVLQVDTCATPIVEIAVNDWDAYERSWDFQSLPLLNASSEPTSTLESSYIAWANKNRDTIANMKRLEEENNSFFIDAYGLQDELSPEVPIEQITLTVNPAYRYGGSLTDDEIWSRFRQDTIKELLSYATGCMMGRYCLDHPGLILADSCESQAAQLTAYEEKVGKPLSEVQFKPDPDCIIPVLDGEWFEDDIVARTREFLAVTFPESSVAENLRFIEDSLGKDIRKYFCSEFYKDHLQTYKKRPIYWMVQSPKKGFACLIYLHRYTKDTLNQVLNNYFRPYLQKLEARLAQLGLDQLNDALPTRDRTAARKEAEKITKVLKECQAWEQDALLPLAQQRIELNLDDGVKVNYLKLQDVLAPIPGLAAKEE